MFVNQITIPAHIQISEDTSFNQLNKVGKSFDYFLDSLEATTAGKKIMDSLRILQPGLMDSLTAFKNKINNHF